MGPRFSSVFVRDMLEPRITSGASIYIEKLPPVGRGILVVMRPGAGLDLEGILDNPAFIIQCRGALNNYSDAEQMALDIDSIILELGSVPYELDGVRIQMMDRVGGAPEKINIPNADENEIYYMFSCTYFARAFTNIGNYK